MCKPAPLRCAGLHNLLPVTWRLYFNKLTKLNIQFLNKPTKLKLSLNEFYFLYEACQTITTFSLFFPKERRYLRMYVGNVGNSHVYLVVDVCARYYSCQVSVYDIMLVFRFSNHVQLTWTLTGMPFKSTKMYTPRGRLAKWFVVYFCHMIFVSVCCFSVWLINMFADYRELMKCNTRQNILLNLPRDAWYK